MTDENKTKQQLIDELAELRQRVAALEGVDAQRRRAEEELTRSEAILTAAVECLPFDFFAVDPDGRCILQNALSRQYYGDALGKTAEQVCPDERVLPRWLEGVRRAMGGERVEREGAWRVGGEDRRFYNVLAPIQRHGTLYGMLGVNVDITERKLAEEALRESEGRYRALAESTRDVIYILDRQGTLLYANQAAAQCIGIGSGEIVGKRQADLFPSEMAQAHVERIGRVFATGEVWEEDELFHFGPEEVWLRIHLLPLRDDAGRITSVMGVCHDITDRKRAEAALQESEKQFRAIFDQAPLGIALVESRSGRFVQINQGYCEIAGRTREEMLTLDFQSITHPETLQADLDNLARVIEGKVHSFHAEKRYLRPDGSTVWIALTVVALWDEGERPRFHLAMVQDISDRKRAEQALQKAHDDLETKVKERTADLSRANEELAIFRKFADASGQGFSMADLDGQLAYLNPALRRMLGEERPEVWIGQHLSICYGEEADRKGKQEIWPALMRDGYWQGELPMLSRQGESIPTWHNCFVIRDERGSPLRVAVAITDITERKRAEEALRQSHDELRVIYEQMADGIVIVDAETTQPVRVNAALCQMLGYSEDEVKTVTTHQVHPPEAMPKVEKFLETVAQGRVARFENMPFLRRDGSVCYADLVTSQILYNGRPCRISFLHDVTERKKAQEALERERQSLWRMLQASDHERQIISYEIHDGLTQYLAAAGMQFQTHDALRENLPDEAKKAYETAVELVRQAHSESRRLISDVRPPVIDEIGLKTALSHLVHERRRRGGPKIECRSSVQFGRLPHVLENALYRIVQEALTNACKHSKSTKVTVAMTQEGQDVRLEVRDWGIGFDPDAVGTGHFGLEGIRQRVRLLGGRLTIESTPGSGTMVQVVVPILETQYEE